MGATEKVLVSRHLREKLEMPFEKGVFTGSLTRGAAQKGEKESF